MNWAKNAAKNLLPLSCEKTVLATALQEWSYDGTTYDLGEPKEACALCDQPDIRYQFEIENRHNGNTLLIGSECITKFEGIEVLDEKGNALPASEAKKKVGRDRRKLITDMQTRSLLGSLVELVRKDTEFDIANFVKFYQERGAFTPKQLTALIWRLEKHSVPHNKSYFKIHIQRQKDKDSLLALQQWQIERMWPCLSTSQKKFLSKHGKALAK